MVLLKDKIETVNYDLEIGQNIDFFLQADFFCLDANKKAMSSINKELENHCQY